jgi:hypothetical protein
MMRTLFAAVTGLFLCMGDSFALTENVKVTPTALEFSQIAFSVETANVGDFVSFTIKMMPEAGAKLSPTSEMLTVRHQDKTVVMCPVVAMSSTKEITYRFGVAVSHFAKSTFTLLVHDPGEGPTSGIVYIFNLGDFVKQERTPNKILEDTGTSAPDPQD